MKTIHTLITTLLLLALVACAPVTSNNKNDGGDAGGSSVFDGTVSNPKVLVLNAAATAGKIGNTDSFSTNESYYKFNAGSETSVLLSITDSSQPQVNSGAYEVRIYSNAAMTTPIADGLFTVDDAVAPVLTGLTESADYYIKVWNKEVSANLTYQIRVAALPVAANEGTSTLSTLDLGETHSGYTTNLSNGVSRYQFNTGAHTSATVSYEVDLLGAAVYSADDFAFANLVDWETLSTTGHSLTLTDLATNTDYYLEIENRASATSRVLYDLVITGE